MNSLVDQLGHLDLVLPSLANLLYVLAGFFLARAGHPSPTL